MTGLICYLATLYKYKTPIEYQIQRYFSWFSNAQQNDLKVEQLTRSFHSETNRINPYLLRCEGFSDFLADLQAMTELNNWREVPSKWSEINQLFATITSEYNSFAGPFFNPIVIGLRKSFFIPIGNCLQEHNRFFDFHGLRLSKHRLLKLLGLSLVNIVGNFYPWVHAKQSVKRVNPLMLLFDVHKCIDASLKVLSAMADQLAFYFDTTANWHNESSLLLAHIKFRTFGYDNQ
jgi:hypothetical protein